MVTDPIAGEALGQFMDLFVDDPAVRLEMEAILSECNVRDPEVRPGDLLNLAQLMAFCELYAKSKDESGRRLVKHACRSAILQFIAVYREMKGTL